MNPVLVLLAVVAPPADAVLAVDDPVVVDVSGAPPVAVDRPALHAPAKTAMHATETPTPQTRFMTSSPDRNDLASNDRHQKEQTIEAPPKSVQV